jgi:hypothetical protein
MNLMWVNEKNVFHLECVKGVKLEKVVYTIKKHTSSFLFWGNLVHRENKIDLPNMIGMRNISTTS